MPSPDTLYLLDPSFPNPAQGDGPHFCKDCITVDGLLATHPDLGTRLTVRRIPYARPRGEVIAVAGEARQNLPLLLFGSDAGEPGLLADAEHEGRKFAVSLDAILDALTERHGFPRRNS